MHSTVIDRFYLDSYLIEDMIGCFNARSLEFYRQDYVYSLMTSAALKVRALFQLVALPGR